MQHYPVIVLGVGGVGSATLLALARRGVRALGLDRFYPGHDRGSSHGQTRIIRQAYYEHPDYVPLVLRAYDLWSQLEHRCSEKLFHQTGLLQVGPGNGVVLQGVRHSARQHGLKIEELAPSQIQKRWPGFRVPGDMAGVFEERAGYLRVEACVVAHAEEAAKLGADLRTGVAVLGWQSAGAGGGLIVRTDNESFTADRLIVTAGPWAKALLADLGVSLEVRRKPQYWFAAETADYDVGRGCSAFLYELPQGVFYGFPKLDDRGVKVARHSGGEVVADPLTVDRSIDLADKALVEQFVAESLPGVSRNLTHHAMCMYTMTPDEHFVVDRHPRWPQVVFAAGLSGHGFKFTPVLGEALADLALEGATKLPIGFLGVRRKGLGIGE